MSESLISWTMAVRCHECGYGVTLRTISLVEPGHMTDERTRLLCDRCGCPKWDLPRPGREVSASVWWDPRTWGRTTWEWRDQDEKPWPLITRSATETT